MSALGDNIRALRALKGLTQAELAEVVGVTRETVVKWENGSIHNLRQKPLRRFLAEFNLSEDDLLSESNGLAKRRSTYASLPNLGNGAPMVPLRDFDTRQTIGSVEVTMSVQKDHPAAYATDVPAHSNHAQHRLPNDVYAVIDPEMSDSRDLPSLIELADGTRGYWMAVVGRSKVMLTPDEGDDLVLDVSELTSAEAVVWFLPKGF